MKVSSNEVAEELIKTSGSPSAPHPKKDEETRERAEGQAESDMLDVFGNKGFAALSAVDAAEFLLRATTEEELQDLGGLVGMCIGKATHTKTNSVERADFVNHSSSSVTVFGHKQTMVMDAEFHVAFDPQTGRPMEYILNVGRLAPTTMMHYTYTAIAPASTPYPASTFAWVAPAGAKVYRKPKETDPLADLSK